MSVFAHCEHMDPDARGPEHSRMASALENVEKPDAVVIRLGRPCSGALHN